MGRVGGGIPAKQSRNHIFGDNPAFDLKFSCASREAATQQQDNLSKYIFNKHGPVRREMSQELCFICCV